MYLLSSPTIDFVSWHPRWFAQEDQNRGKPNWEHLNDELHVLITVEDTENRAKVKLQRATDEIKKLLIPSVGVSYSSN